MFKAFVLVILFLAYIDVCSQKEYEPLFQPTNLDFETGNEGTLPLGWKVTAASAERGYDAKLTSANVFAGRYCLELFNNEEYKEGVYGSLMQTVDAIPFRGKRVKLTAAVRAEISSPEGSAHLWIREHLIHGQDGIYEGMEDDPIIVNNWAVYEISVEIDKFADVINFGLMLKGTGKCWIDDAKFEIIIESEEDILPPKILNEQELFNISSFSKIYGYVRYFHPSEEARIIDWEKLAIEGIQHTTEASDNSDLVKRLNSIFKPIAPGISISNDTRPLENKITTVSKPDSAVDKVCLAWIQMLGGLDLINDNVSKNIANIFSPRRERDGTVFQIVDAEKLKGKKIRFSVWAKAEPIGPDSRGQLWLRIDGENNKTLYTEINDDREITSIKWENYTIEAEVPLEAKEVRLGLIFLGDGKIWFDDASLTYTDGNTGLIDAGLRNGDFELGTLGGIVRNWLFPRYSQNAGYNSFNDTKFKRNGNQSLTIESDLTTRIAMPDPGEVYNFKLDDILVSVPIALYMDTNRTIPHPDPTQSKLKLSKGLEFVPTIRDRATRIAAVAIMWNILRHFHVFDINSNDLEKALPLALAKASETDDKESFIEILEELLAISNDGQARVWHGNSFNRLSLPFLLEYIDGEVIISKTAEGLDEPKVGDKLISIGKNNINKILQDFSVKTPGATEQWKMLRALAKIRSVRGDTTTMIGVNSGENKTKEIEVDKLVFIDDLVIQRPPKIEVYDDSTFYIDMTRMSDEEFIGIIDSLKSAKKIIFDLRGISKMSEYVLSIFTNENLETITWNLPVFTRPEGDLISYKYIKSEINPYKVQLRIKPIFLIDERTIGYSEGIASTIKTNKAGTLIGRETAGTAGDIMPIRLPGDINFTLTAIKGYTPDGKLLFGKGIQPDILVNKTKENSIQDKDPILDRAFSE